MSRELSHFPGIFQIKSEDVLTKGIIADIKSVKGCSASRILTWCMQMEQIQLSDKENENSFDYLEIKLKSVVFLRFTFQRCESINIHRKPIFNKIMSIRECLDLKL